MGSCVSTLAWWLPLAVCLGIVFGYLGQAMFHDRLFPRWLRLRYSGEGLTVQVPLTSVAGDPDGVLLVQSVPGQRGVCVLHCEAEGLVRVQDLRAALDEVEAHGARMRCEGRRR